jgi:hypothetical protein
MTQVPFPTDFLQKVPDSKLLAISRARQLRRA